MKLTCLFFCCFSAISFANSDSVVLGKSRIKAEYYRPVRTNAPAVVLMHGCAGLYDKNKELAIRYARMTSQLQELDFAVLLLDDRLRNKNTCAVTRISNQKKEMQRRAKNLQLAIAWLKQRREVDRNRIAVVGWDTGATATLQLLNQKKPGIRSATVFSPNCKLLLGADFRVAAPTLLLAGQQDGLTPFAHCSELSQVSGQSLFHLVSYPDARHDFDLMLEHLEQEALNLPRNHLALEEIADPAAAQDAWRRTYKWLSRWFDPERSMEGIPPRQLP
jgi:dienelactone hydrolase